MLIIIGLIAIGFIFGWQFLFAILKPLLVVILVLFVLSTIINLSSGYTWEEHERNYAAGFPDE